MSAEKTENRLTFERHFTDDDSPDPYQEIDWILRSARINGADGHPVFEQENVEAPEFWSQMAVNVVASKYFRGAVGHPDREYSVNQLVQRVTDTITDWGLRDGYFDEETAQIFNAELSYLILHQMGTFNSPVWFNVGVVDKPQGSACFINSVKDDIDSIMGLARTEAKLFKEGSGTGTNFSPLRSCREGVAGGGTASGPVSFMKGFDAFAGVIKSGGKTRRAAKIVILDVDHPDILEFIQCKSREERKAQVLIAAGYDPGIDGEAYASVSFQNANHSVRVTDEFMQAATWSTSQFWVTRARTGDNTWAFWPAKRLLNEIAQCAWECGDPGLQFDTTINRWNTCPSSGRINASNPCGEFMFLDDTACNLASLNLLKFLGEDGQFAVDSFCHAVDLLITAQDIIVDRAGYPTEKIAKNSKRFRPLGLGYANLGALLMALGLPYDSDEGRAYAAAITSLMTGEAYRQSALIARLLGTFPEFGNNSSGMALAVNCHAEHTDLLSSKLPQSSGARNVLIESKKTWYEVKDYVREPLFGFRNAQVTLLAPTGTTAFMMDCDTTGIEPEFALVKRKNLVGGGEVSLVNRTVPAALRRLGYAESVIPSILAYLEREGNLEKLLVIHPEHLPVFDCALRTGTGVRSIDPMGHVKMVAAVQPFLSGAVSKTVNLPAEATVEDVEQVFAQSWHSGLKAVTVYREGSKQSQPLNPKTPGQREHHQGECHLKEQTNANALSHETLPPPDTTERREHKGGKRCRKHRLPDERASITHKFSIAGHEGYLTVGMYEDGTPGEIFIRMAKAGSTVRGLADAIALAVSIGLQYGVPLSAYVDKYAHSRFEPAGYTTNPQIPIAKSIIDYVARWLGMKFPGYPGEGEETGKELTEGESFELHLETAQREEREVYNRHSDAPVCADCGGLMSRNGACYRCMNCGSTSGCS